MNVKIKRLPTCYQIPTYKHPGDAGADLYSAANVIISPGKTATVPTGVCIEIPDAFEGQVRPRSSILYNTMLGFEVGTIDSGYRGEIHVIIRNLGTEQEMICVGDRIAQLVIAPVIRAEFESVWELGASSRGENRFGSTGGFKSSEGGIR